MKVVPLVSTVPCIRKLQNTMQRIMSIITSALPDPCAKTVEENWQLFKTCIQDSVTQCVSQKTIKN